jgi:uncharacterized membrane protein YhaH (DUF805 family)
VREIVATWFSLSKPVGPRFYAASGCGLAAFKFAVDAVIVWYATGTVWTPLGYLNPSLAMREGSIGLPPTTVFWTLVVWSLPFYWIGITMTVRRTIDAGLAPTWALLFFVPIVNYLFMVLLCLLPPRAAAPRPTARPDDTLAGTLRSTATATVIGLGMMLFSVVLLGGYGASLFLGTPFVMGFAVGFLLNRDAPRGVLVTLAASYLSLVGVGGVILLIAIEGLLCLLMAAPPALLLASLGALLGRQLVLGAAARSAIAVSALLAALPLLTGFEAPTLRGPLREVATSVTIDASPEMVWPNVIAVSELPPPSGAVFRLGIAYPQRAVIRGSGPGAVRTCEFSTGAFVEPITVWDPPRRLAFSVRSQPPPMTEWSPYRHVNAPHLVDGLRSERGEFRLIPLASGGTRLEGSTWYHNNLFPQFYWNLWSDAFIHHIHRRVLEHVKRQSEPFASAP